MFERYDQKLVVFAFYGRFDMLLATILGFPRRFTGLRVITKNSMFLRFMPIFISYLPIVLGFRGIEMTVRPDTCLRHDQKLIIFVFYGRFHELLPEVLEFQGDLHVSEL